MRDWLPLVRRAARANVDSRALAGLVEEVGGRLDEVERAIAASLRVTRRNAHRLLHGFERLAAADGTCAALGRAARLRGSWLLHGGDAAGALAAYQRAEQMLTGIARDGARLGLAGAQMRLGRTDDAAATCARVRRAARRRGDTHVAAASDVNCGVAWIEGGQPQRALAPLRRAVDAFARAKSELLAATAEQSLANALVLIDTPREAEVLLASAGARMDALGMRHEAARCRLNRGALLRRSERLDDAEQTLVSAESAARAAGDATLAAQCRLERAEVLLAIGLAGEASDLVRTALVGLRRAPPIERVRARLVAAEAALADGDPAAAQKRLGGTRTGPVSVPVSGTGTGRVDASTPLLDGRRHLLRARAALARARAAAARREADLAARAFGNAHLVSRAMAHVLGAEAARRGGDTEAARRLLASAAPGSRRAAPETAHARFARSAVAFLVEADAGQRDAADDALDAARSALRTMRASRRADRTRAAVLVGRDAWIARAVRHLLASPDGPAEAERFIDETRARALIDFEADARAVVGIDGVAAGSGEDDVAVARTHLDALERRLDGDPGDGAIRTIDGRAPSRAQLLRAERRLALALSPHGTGVAAPATRAPLGRDAVVVTYHVDDAGALAFVERGGDVAVRELPTDRRDLAGAVRALRFRLAQHAIGAAYRQRHEQRLARSVATALADVAARLVAPIADDLAACAQVIVIPHGAAFGVPFAALPLGDGAMVDRCSVTFAPSRTSRETATRAARGRPLVLAHADARADAIREEAAHVASILPRSRLRTGDDATRGALGVGAAPRVLHIAAHGRHRPESPAMSGLLLADGWLRAADLAHLPLAGSTVVLSGCETGVTEPRAGGEVLGLVRGALLGGARSVVASLWRVDDPATARLMSLFHGALRGRRSAAEALAEAQRACRAEGAGPWLWAGFAAWTAAAGRNS